MTVLKLNLIGLVEIPVVVETLLRQVVETLAVLPSRQNVNSARTESHQQHRCNAYLKSAYADYFHSPLDFEKELRERSRRFVVVKKMYGRKYSESQLMLDKDKLF